MFLDTPPQNLEAEQALLGSLLLEASMIPTVSFIEPTDFYKEAHAEIYKAITLLHSQGNPADSVTMMNYLEAQGYLEKCGGPAYLSTLIESCPTPFNAASYANIVIEKSRLRMASRAGSRLSNAAMGDMQSFDIINDAQAELNTIVNHRVPETESMKDNCALLCRELSERAAHGGGILGLPTGLRHIDEMLSGLRRKYLMIIAGRPKMGKTSLAIQISDYLVLDGKRVLFVSLEMPASEVTLKIISLRTGINSRDIERASLSEIQWQKVYREFERLSSCGWVVRDRAGLRVNEVMNVINQAHSEQPIDLIVVDHASLVHEDPKEHRHIMLGRLSAGLYEWSKINGPPVILICQLGRGAEESSTRQPRMSDLRESGALEQNCGAALFVHRPRLIGANEPLSYTELILLLNRYGPPGMVKADLHFDGMWFEEMGFDDYTGD
jgi:replicative DNA helicase